MTECGQPRPAAVSATKKRALSPFFQKLVYVLSLIFTVFNIAVLAFFPMNTWTHLASCVGFAMGLIFIIYKGPFEGDRPTALHVVLDVLLIAATIFATVYYSTQHDEMIYRVSVFPELGDILTSAILIIVVMEATRRSSSAALCLVAGLFLAYAFFGKYLPASLGHAGFSYKRVLTYMAGDNGIWGVGVGAATSYVFLFIVFGAFLDKFGGGQVFIDLSTKLAGHYRGGPAKVAVISSALFGTISGSAIANVAATGAFTIPMMKKIGYRSEFAGAVESAASTGGQIMPPVMGSCAFIMAEIVGVSYAVLARKALVPACLYFFAILVMVDCEALNAGLRGLAKAPFSEVKKLLREKWAYLLPIIVVFVSLLALNVSTSRAALYGIVSCLAVPVFSARKTFKPKSIIDALAAGGTGVVSIVAVCAVAGIVVGVLAMTGLGMKIATVLLELSGGRLIPLLISTMCLSIILGMGLSALPAYIIAASVSAPILVRAGVPMLTAHLFVYYYSIFAVITPPVALASYAAAGIADADVSKVGFEGFKLASAGIVVPFIFAHSPALLMQGSFFEIVSAVLSAVLGIVVFGCAIQGYCFKKIGIVQRVLLFGAALLMVYSGAMSDIAGVALAAVTLLLFPATRSEVLATCAGLLARFRKD